MKENILTENISDINQMSETLDFEETLLALECAKKILRHLKRQQKADIAQLMVNRQVQNIRVVEEIISIHHQRLTGFMRQTG